MVNLKTDFMSQLRQEVETRTTKINDLTKKFNEINDKYKENDYCRRELKDIRISNECLKDSKKSRILSAIHGLSETVFGIVGLVGYSLFSLIIVQGAYRLSRKQIDSWTAKFVDIADITKRGGYHFFYSLKNKEQIERKLHANEVQKEKLMKKINLLKTDAEEATHLYNEIDQVAREIFEMRRVFKNSKEYSLFNYAKELDIDWYYDFDGPKEGFRIDNARYIRAYNQLNKEIEKNLCEEIRD